MNAPNSTRLLRCTSALSGLMVFMVLCYGASPATAAEHRLGLGAHFWKTVDEIADDGGFSDIEEDGYALVASYRYEPGGFLFFQVDVDYYQDGFGGSSDSAISPRVLVGAGGNFYVAVGIGTTFADGFENSMSDPFYVGRVGFELDLLPGVSLDLNANYEADAFAEVDNFETDATTFGAVLRFSL